MRAEDAAKEAELLKVRADRIKKAIANSNDPKKTGSIGPDVKDGKDGNAPSAEETEVALNTIIQHPSAVSVEMVDALQKAGDQDGVEGISRVMEGLDNTIGQNEDFQDLMLALTVLAGGMIFGVDTATGVNTWLKADEKAKVALDKENRRVKEEDRKTRADMSNARVDIVQDLDFRVC